jgi:DNA gyrase subunit A
MIMAAKGKILRCRVGDIREIGRNTQGVRMLELEDADDRVVAVARLAEAGEREEAVSGNGAPGDVNEEGNGSPQSDSDAEV